MNISVNMGSRFLSSGGTDLSALQDGSTPINVASAIVQSLTPSLPIHTDASKNLIAGLINLVDCNFAPLVNPAASTLDMGGYDITDIKELLIESNSSPSTPPINNLTLYESGDKLRYKDSSASVFQVATTTDIGSYLPLAGGTMSGAIAMGTNNITNVGTISGATNSRTADNIVSNAGASTSGNVASFSGVTGKVVTDSGVIAASIVTGPASAVSGNVATYNGITGKLIQDSGASLSQYLPLSGGTMTGDIDMNGWNIRHIFTITDSGVNTLKGVRNLLCNSNLTMTAGNLPAYVGTTDGYVQDSGVVAASIVTGPASAVSGNVATYNGITGKIIQDSGASLSQYLPLAGGTMSGAIAMGTNNITNAGTISGATNSRTADNIVSNAGTSTSGNVASFSGTTGKVVADSGVVVANVVTNVGTSTSGNVASFSGATGKVVTDSGHALSEYALLTGATFSGAIAMGTNNITNAGTISGATNSRTADNIVSNAGTSTSGNVASFSGTTGKVVTDSGVVVANVVTNAGTGASGNLASFSSNKVVQDSAIASSNVALLTGATFSGAIDSASALNLGTSAATSVNLGKVGIITNITGSPPSLGKFATTSNNNLSGVTTVQNLLTSGVGSLAYAANSTYTGTIIRYRFTGVTSNTSPNTQTVILAVNGTSAISIVWAPGSVTNAPFTITGILAVRASGGYADMFIDTNTTGTTLTQQVNATLPTWDKTAINTLSASIQFSNASSTGVVYHSMFETMFD